MLTRKTIVVAFGVISAGAIACQNNTPGTTNNAPSPSPPAAPNPEATSVAPVTNTNAVAPADPLALAENKTDIKQYPDEYKFSPPRQAKMITGFSAEVRSAPSGDSISTVETAANVTEVARDAKGNYYLVLYPDTKDSSKQLAGWVYKDALENVAWSETVPTQTQGKALSNTMATKLDCSTGQAHLRTDRDFCGKTCKDDKGCDKAKGEICDGLAFEVRESTSKVSNARYCISSTSPFANNAHGPEHGTSAALDHH